MTVESARARLTSTEDACIECGLCTDSCDVIGERRLTIGQVASRLLAGETSGEVVDAVVRCSMCGFCCSECPVDIDVRATMQAARAHLDSAGVLAGVYDWMLIGDDLGSHTIYKDAFGITWDDITPPSFDVAFFPGCSLSTYGPELVRSVHGWLTERGDTVGIIDGCCGASLRHAGMAERVELHHQRVRDALAAGGVRRIVVACPECLHELRQFLDGVEVVPLSRLFREAGVRVGGTETLTVFDSCVDRWEPVTGPDVREILSGYPMKEMRRSDHDSVCCGSGGLVCAVDPDLAATTTATRIAEADATSADYLVTACMSCAHRFSAVTGQARVLHYLELVFDQRVDWGEVERRFAELYGGSDEQEGAA